MKALKFSLYLGFGYFLLMALAHLSGMKIAGLFIYFNVPSYVYQDKLIGLLTFGWAALFFGAARTVSRQLIQLIIGVGALAIGILFYINFSTDFTVLSKEINPVWFHLEVGILLVYWLWLVYEWRNSNPVWYYEKRYKPEN